MVQIDESLVSIPCFLASAFPERGLSDRIRLARVQEDASVEIRFSDQVSQLAAIRALRDGTLQQLENRVVGEFESVTEALRDAVCEALGTGYQVTGIRICFQSGDVIALFTPAEV